MCVNVFLMSLSFWRMSGIMRGDYGNNTLNHMCICVCFAITAVMLQADGINTEGLLNNVLFQGHTSASDGPMGACQECIFKCFSLT